MKDKMELEDWEFLWHKAIAMACLQRASFLLDGLPEETSPTLRKVLALAVDAITNMQPSGSKLDRHEEVQVLDPSPKNNE